MYQTMKSEQVAYTAYSTLYTPGYLLTSYAVIVSEVTNHVRSRLHKPNNLFLSGLGPALFLSQVRLFAVDLPT